MKDSAIVDLTSPTAYSRTPADNTQSTSGVGQLSGGHYLLTTCNHNYGTSQEMSLKTEVLDDASSLTFKII